MIHVMRVARPVQAILIVLVAAIYGAADQYLGSRIQLGEWTVAVSQMSAPWLAIAFVTGAWPVRRGHAVVIGTAVTFAAVAGYMVMMLSPVEGVTLSAINWPAELRSQLHVILPACLTGPLFGWLGWRWRREQSVAPALLIAALFAFEPVVRAVAGMQIESRSVVWLIEAGSGVLAGVAVALRRAAASQA